MMVQSRPVAFLLAAALTGCGAQSVTATEAEPDAASMPDAQPQEQTDAQTDADAGLTIWPPPCRDFASQPSDEYFPREPLLRAADVEPGLRFVAISKFYVLSTRSDGTPVVVLVLADPEQMAVAPIELPDGPVELKDIAAGAQTEKVGVLACTTSACELFVPTDDGPGEPLAFVAHPAGAIPLPGKPGTLVVHGEGPGETFCVLGDGAACLEKGAWRIWIEPGSGPALRAMTTGWESTVFVGDEGRVVTIGENGMTEERMTPELPLTHVAGRGESFIVLGEGDNEAMTWSKHWGDWSQCPFAGSPVLAFKAADGILHGIRADGFPFREGVIAGQPLWVNLIPWTDGDVHGDLIDGDVYRCGVKLNYLGLQPEAVLGTLNCHMGY